MIGGGYYIVEYNYKDKVGHIRTKREMRGTFDLTLEVYKHLSKLYKEKDPKAPIRNPRLLQYCWGGNEKEISFKEELEEWRKLKGQQKKK